MKTEVKSELYEKLIEHYRFFTKWVLKYDKDIIESQRGRDLLFEIDEIDKQIKEAENTPVESKNNVELFEKIEKLKRDITKKRKGWVFPNEGYIEATGMIMICDQILDWIKIESQELPAEVKPTASITDIMLFLEKNGIKQGYNIGVRDCARLIQEFIAQWSQPHSDIVSDREIEKMASEKTYGNNIISDERELPSLYYNGLIDGAKWLRDRQRMKLRERN